MGLLVVNPTELFRQLGRTLTAIQVLEYNLCHYLSLWTKKPAAEARDLLESSLKHSLGELIKALHKHNIIPQGFESMLEEFRKERNWLVHRLYAENWYDLCDTSKAPAVLDRITHVHSESQKLAHLFSWLNEQWCLANGVTVEQLERSYQEMFDTVINP